MKPLKAYIIPFVGLKEGTHHFSYTITNTFFEHFEYDELESADIKVLLEFRKKTTFFELNFQIDGLVGVVCDVTNEPFELPVSNEIDLVVKFGDEFNDENEELLIIPHGEYELNIQQYIYEAVVLALPQKRVHPGVEDGTLDSDILKKLEELHPGQGKKSVDTDVVDPRWDKLKNLLKDN